MKCYYVPNVKGRSGKGRCLTKEKPRERGYKGEICKRKTKQLNEEITEEEIKSHKIDISCNRMIKALLDHGEDAKKVEGMTNKKREHNKTRGYENIRS